MGKEYHLDAKQLEEMGLEMRDGAIRPALAEGPSVVPDILGYADVVDAPFRRGIHEAIEGEGTGIKENLKEFGRGFGKQVSEYGEKGVLPAIKEAPSFGVAGDILTSPTTYTPLGIFRSLGLRGAMKGAAKVSPFSIGARWRGRKAAEKALAKKTTALTPQAEKMKALAHQVFDDPKLVRMINKPKKLREYLSGKPIVKKTKDSTTGEMGYRQTTKAGGAIQKKTKELDDWIDKNIDKFHKEKAGLLHGSFIETRIIAAIQDQVFDEKTGAKVSKITSEQLQGMLERLLPKVPKPGYAVPKGKPPMMDRQIYDLKDLVKMRRLVLREMSSKNFKMTAPPDPDNMKILKAMYKGISDAIDDVLPNNKLKGTFDAKNRVISNMLHLEEMLNSPSFAKLQGTGFADAVWGAFMGGATGGAIGLGAGTLAGHSVMGGLIGGGVGTAAGAGGAVYRSSAKQFPGKRARMWKAAEQEGTGVRLPFLGSKAIEKEEVEQSRTPQSVIMEGLNRNKVPNLPEEIIRTKLPRTVDEIMKNADFLLMKVAQEAPEMFDLVKDTLQDDPDGFREILPQLTQQAPELFVRDKYNRVDNMIMDPKDQIAAREDTMKDDNKTLMEKMEIINHLNKTGEFYAN